MTLRSRDKAVLAAVAVVALLAALYLLILAPVRHHASRLDASIASEQRTLVQDEGTYQAGRAAQLSLRKQGTQFRALARAVPRSSDIPALLRIIEGNARAVRVKVQSISLSGGSGGTASSSVSAPVSGATGAAGATSVPVSLTFTGTYSALDRLINRLDRLVVVSGQRVHASGPLTSISSVSLTGSAPALTAQLSASIYQLTPAASTASSPAPTSGGSS